MKFYSLTPSTLRRRQSLSWLFLSACFFALISAKESGCRRSGGDSAEGKATTPRSVDFLRKKLASQDRPQVHQLNAQAQVYIEGNGQSIAATANIIWIRDSVMWVNIRKFGLEAARALVTKDSVFVLNRLDKTYSARRLESLQRQYSLPAGFELMQSMLLAGAWVLPDMPLESDVKDGYHRLSGSNGRTAADYRLAEDHFWLRQEIFLQPRDAQTMSVVFENYKKTDVAGWFPYLRTLEAYSPNTGDLRLSIELHDVEFNVPKQYRFEIPQHYERVD